MARHRITVRLDDDESDAYDGLQEICAAWNVSQTALIQALIEVSVSVYRAGGDENRAPVFERAKQIDTQRRRRKPL